MSDIERVNWKKFFFSFEGRVNRKKYWMNYALPLFLLMLMLPAIVGSVFGWQVAPVASGILSIVSIWPKFAIGAKRLHDRELSGWWQISPLVAIVLAGIGAMIFKPLAVLFIIIAAGLGIWIAVQIGFLKGTDGPNRFGPDPLKPLPRSIDDDIGPGAADIHIEPVGAGE